MTTIYLVNNSYIMNNLNFDNNESLKNRREKRILSIEGEKASEELAKSKIFEGVNAIYSSPFVMSIGTSKYLAQDLELAININPSVGERIIGDLGNQKIRALNELQENDFDYKLNGGESLNEVKKRMLYFIKYLLNNEKDSTVAVFTHNVAITCLLSEYCEKGFNLDNRLILNYNGNAIVDGTWDGITIIELDFDGEELVNITRKK
ncbi:MAG: histidine phosphatase family protein [Ruminococcus sp.]|nr:histidine phosphatase family protein [Ruminococcus sp.]